jgi:chemotaxis protein histidine kinase CheA
VDWAQDPELKEIFETELRERSERLARYSRALANRALPESKFADAKRDAHTIKGNAAVMGHRKVSDALAVVEDVWKSVAAGLGVGGASFGNLMAEVVDRTLPALTEPGIMEPYITALCDANGVSLPPSWESGTKVIEQPSLTVDPPPHAPAVSHLDPVQATASESTFHSLATDQPDLGGLIGNRTGLMMDDSIRVDVPRLRTVVDQSATVRLDVEALIGALRRYVLPGEQEGWISASEGLIRGVRKLQEGAESLGRESVGSATQSIRQLAVHLARRQNKEVKIDLLGTELEVDRGLLDLVREPLRHLVVNAIEHGIESVTERVAAGKSREGTVSVSFTKEEGTLRIVVSDDGAGVQWKKVEEQLGEVSLDGPALTSALFEAGFSTAPPEGEFSGDGSGLELVGRAISSVHGGLVFDTQSGLGSRVEMRLPVSVVMQDLLSIDCAGERWSLPVASVVGVLPFDADDVSPGVWQPEYLFEGKRIPFASLSEALSLESDSPLGHVLILATRGVRIALAVPAVHSSRKAVLKRLSGVMSGIEFLAGIGVLGGGETVAVIDPDYVGTLLTRPPAEPAEPAVRPKVLVVDDSLAVRQVMVAGLTSIGFDVDATDGVVGGLALFEEQIYDAVVVDLYLEDGDGIEFVDQLRLASATVPIVMVSGVAHQVDRQRALTAGANFFFDKADLRKGAFIETLRSLAMDVEAAPV